MRTARTIAKKAKTPDRKSESTTVDWIIKNGSSTMLAYSESAKRRLLEIVPNVLAAYAPVRSKRVNCALKTRKRTVDGK